MKSLMIKKYGDLTKNLEIQEVPLPSFGSNQILIKTHAASFNPLDYKIVRGDFKAIRKLDFPKGIGRDVSGIVEKVGKNVKMLHVGVFLNSKNENRYKEFS